MTNRKGINSIIANNRRGISPIIATLLLILIAIAAGVILYAYVIGFAGTATTGSASGNTNLTTDQVALNSSSGVTTVVLKNVGGTTAGIGNGLYLKGGTLTNIAQQGWRVTLLSTSGSPTAISDVNVTMGADTSHVNIGVKMTSGTVTYTASFLSNTATYQCTITITTTTTGKCGSPITLPTGVTVSTGFVADTGTIAITPTLTKTTNFGVSTSTGVGTGSLSLSPSATAETDLFAIGGTATAGLTAGNIYNVQLTANDGSTFIYNVKAF
jgi:flagellin-like protein